MESPRRSLEEDVLSLALRETEKALDSSISRALDEASRDLYASACGGSDVDSDLEDEVDGGGTRGLATMQEELRRANEAVLSNLVETHRSAAAKREAALARVEAYRETRRSEGKRLLEEVQRGAERTPAPRLSVASGLPPELAEVEGRHRASAANTAGEVPDLPALQREEDPLAAYKREWADLHDGGT